MFSVSSVVKYDNLYYCFTNMETKEYMHFNT